MALFLSLLVAVSPLATAADTLLDKAFCGAYYTVAAADGYPPCEAVRAKVISNMSRTLPTLELGDPSQKGLFFIHGWPDSAAEWAPQFAHFCATGRYYCVAVTWANFHPDLPNAPTAELTFVAQFDKIRKTMGEVGLRDPTLVIHDWGSFIGYNMLNIFPGIANRVISFDIGSGGHPNVTYQQQNRDAWAAQDSTKSIGSANYWWAPIPEDAVWRESWPYCYNISFKGLTPHNRPPSTLPLLFLWGNMTRGQPRQVNAKFFDHAWVQFVLSTPHGRVIEVKSDHWMHLKAPRVSNEAIDAWLSTTARLQTIEKEMGSVDTAAAAALLSTPHQQRRPPQRLIIDTDMSTDCDDVGALCLAHALADAGEAEIIAVVHDTGLDTGVGAVAALNAFYGRHDIPIGAYKGSFDATIRGSYVDDVVAHSAAAIKNYSQVPDAVAVYRAALAAAPNGSVMISSIGFTTNLEALLKSGPDAASPLTGVELVASRVQGIAWMGGRYPAVTSPAPGEPTWSKGAAEHNFGFHNIGPSTAYTLEHWPKTVSITFLGWEVGTSALTGGPLMAGTPESNLCRRAYLDHQGHDPKNPRSSWDPMTTMFAVRGAESFYSLHDTGYNTINRSSGSNAWAPGQNGSQAYLVLKVPPHTVAAVIDAMLIKPPALH